MGEILNSLRDLYNGGSVTVSKVASGGSVAWRVHYPPTMGDVVELGVAWSDLSDGATVAVTTDTVSTACGGGFPPPPTCYTQPMPTLTRPPTSLGPIMRAVSG